MRKKIKLFFIVCALFLFLIGVPALLFFNKYGDLIVEQDAVVNRWSQVNYLYQRRMSSIQTVMDTISGYEQQTAQLKEILSRNEQLLAIDFVNASMQQDSLFEKEQADITDAIQWYLVQVSDSNMALLHSQDTINQRIADARYDYNEAVRKFNTHIHHFPSKWIARIMGMSDKNYFESKP